MKGPDGLPGTADDVLVEGNPAAPISLANAVRTGHPFLDDIAHFASPVGDHDGNPGTPDQLLDRGRRQRRRQYAGAGTSTTTNCSTRTTSRATAA